MGLTLRLPVICRANESPPPIPVNWRAIVVVPVVWGSTPFNLVVVWFDHIHPGVLSSGERTGDDGGNRSYETISLFPVKPRRPKTHPAFTTPDPTIRITLGGTIQLLSAPWLAWLSPSSPPSSFFAATTETGRMPSCSRRARNDAPLHWGDRLQTSRAGSRPTEPRKFGLVGWRSRRGLFKPLRYRSGHSVRKVGRRPRWWYCLCLFGGATNVANSLVRLHERRLPSLHIFKCSATRAASEAMSVIQFG